MSEDELQERLKKMPDTRPNTKTGTTGRDGEQVQRIELLEVVVAAQGARIADLEQKLEISLENIQNILRSRLS